MPIQWDNTPTSQPGGGQPQVPPTADDGIQWDQPQTASSTDVLKSSYQTS